MNLWPFSKKASDEFVLDSTMNLPPGVVLATPDDPALAELPIPSVPTPETTTDEHSATTAIQDPPALPKQNDPPLSPEIQQILGIAPPPALPQPPTSDLPDLPAELFGESAPESAPWLETVSTPPVAEPSPAPTFELDSAVEAPGLWTPSEFELEPTTIAYAEPPAPATEMPSLIPDPAMSGPILSELFQEANNIPPQPTIAEHQPLESPTTPVNPAYSPVQSFADDEPSWEILPDPDMESDQFYTPLEAFDDNTIDPIPLNPPSHHMDASALSFSMGDVDEIAALMPPDPEPDVVSNRNTSSDTAQHPQVASGELADLLADAQAFQIDASWDSPAESELYHAQAVSNDDFNSDDFAPPIDVETSSGNTSFFASATFEEMDNFGQPSSASPLYIEETTAAVPLDGACLATDNDIPELYIQNNQSNSDPETEWASPTDDETPSELLVLDEEAPYMPEYDIHTTEQPVDEQPDEFSSVHFDDGMEIVDDSLSYDFGHYDDPDEPAVAFVLDADESDEQPPQPLETNPDNANQINMENFPAQISAQYYVGADLPSESADLAYSQTIPSPLPQAKPEPEPIKPPPPSQPIERAVQKPLPSEPIPPKLPPRHTYHTDSITEALDSFEQEMLMRDSHFITQSINNLVERYFAQKKAENEW